MLTPVREALPDVSVSPRASRSDSCSARSTVETAVFGLPTVELIEGASRLRMPVVRSTPESVAEDASVIGAWQRDS